MHKWFHDVVKNDAEWYKTMQICKKKTMQISKKWCWFPKKRCWCLLRIHIYFYVLQRKYCLKIGKGKRTKEPKSYGPSRKWGGVYWNTKSATKIWGGGGGWKGIDLPTDILVYREVTLPKVLRNYQVWTRFFSYYL